MTLTQQIRNAIDNTAPVWHRLNAVRVLVGLPPAKRGRPAMPAAQTKEAQALRNKERYDRLVASGRCVVCAKNPTEPGQRRCDGCKAKRKPKTTGA